MSMNEILENLYTVYLGMIMYIYIYMAVFATRYNTKKRPRKKYSTYQRG